ncbi:hypothetical protein [Acetobacter oeni]|uniref:Uncharacterized protein n=1 Tax=Acetobacter oeni TaxID=304077 RepID=A0A511XPD8_9PROT|nr:hypothetical protein [Acetobacter oeni]MBB3884588.1 hypothetical protein [Acetobacter oeni]NHO20557.1 hypothetical protein [Acetobacter oeni]GBR06520.1 hypothetical protein AA21952_2043 [Acetobacter oeni LMG 21952]GEN64828.1 hypothetical protein AOE01nite_30520 [Acetobacter oeni]
MARSTSSFRMLPRPWDPSALHSGETKTGHFTCGCCGLATAGRSFFWNNDRRGSGRVCAVCDILQNLTRPAIEREAVLVWWPEFPQTRIMTLTRCAHQTLIGALGDDGASRDTAWHRIIDAIAAGADAGMIPMRCQPSVSVLRALHARSGEARRRLETTSPRQLATALLMANRSEPQTEASIAGLLEGLRILPLGRLYDGATDIYPALLREWTGAVPSHSTL